ncbi:hypothetical protein IW261DRAFT_1597151 [Armillaria novae-zelandiae]|uniref:Uncharacterized protein n=1 Tax=Armillaria novae-zelandiae TaxID=153914 RepID=A0AA39NTU8_9AGAR|nr:hypothetical protein IW261DRAFT_1597151 [Armillaria novae-zelandiae]
MHYIYRSSSLDDVATPKASSFITRDGSNYAEQYVQKDHRNEPSTSRTHHTTKEEICAHHDEGNDRDGIYNTSYLDELVRKKLSILYPTHLFVEHKAHEWTSMNCKLPGFTPDYRRCPYDIFPTHISYKSILILDDRSYLAGNLFSTQQPDHLVCASYLVHQLHVPRPPESLVAETPIPDNNSPAPQIRRSRSHILFMRHAKTSSGTSSGANRSDG